MKFLLGLWLIAHADMGGQDLTAVFKSQRLEITESGYRIWSDGVITDAGELIFYGDSNALDIRGVEGPNKGKFFRCICKSEGDVLTICYNLTHEGARPKEFRATADNKFLLIIYKKKTL